MKDEEKLPKWCEILLELLKLNSKKEKIKLF